MVRNFEEHINCAFEYIGNKQNKNIGMRLDLVLKQTGLIKRRVIAKELAENGKVLINERVGKPSSEVKKDDVITISFGQKKINVKIDFVTKGRKEIPISLVLEEGYNND